MRTVQSVTSTFRLSTVHVVAALYANLIPHTLTNGAKAAQAARLRRLEEAHEPQLPIIAVKTAIEDALAFTIEGDAKRALFAARRAYYVAPGKAWRVWPLATRAWILRSFGEVRAADDHAHDALVTLNEVAWEKTTDEERMGMLATVEQVRHFDVPAAIALVERFEALKTPMHSRIALDARAQSFCDLTIGAVYASAGDRRRAEALLVRAYEGYSGIGYLWRALEALIELDAVAPSRTVRDRSGAAMTPHDLAVQLCGRHFPKSPLWLRLGLGCGEFETVNLTLAEREVLQYFVAGKTPVDIAAATGRSVKTVRNHLSKIYFKFGVQSGTALFGECRRRGLFLGRSSMASSA